MDLQDRFEAIYADRNDLEIAWVKDQRNDHESYYLPSISRAWRYFKEGVAVGEASAVGTAEKAEESISKTDCGHGHVYPRSDGVRARCGGPGMCKRCSVDAQNLEFIRARGGNPGQAEWVKP